MSKLDYLKKYVSKGETLGGDDGGKPKKKKKKKLKASSGKKGGNLAIVDDDVDWRGLLPEDKGDSSAAEDDPEDKPTVAEMRDESVVKWQPLGHSAPSTTSQREGRGTGTDTKVQSPDLSPPGNSRNRHDSADNSPPRRRRHDSPDLSPARVQSRSAQSLVVSPPRHRARHNSPDISPPRRGRHDSTDDLSPPRKGGKSQHRKQKHHDSVDVRGRHDSPNISPPHKTRHDSPDISPPHKTRHDSPDISPPRKTRHDSPDISPPRKARHDSPDISPPRKTRHDSPDLSPQRQKRSGTDLSPPRKKSRWNVKDSQSLPGRAVGQAARQPASPTQMTSGKKAGLQEADVLRQENAEARVRETEKFQAMDPSESGQGAETVYRDKHGHKINPKLERLKQKQEERKKMEEEEKFMEWGKGVATLRMVEDKVKDELYEMSKPLARYADDEDLERMLKERERYGDPMLKFMKKKPKLMPTGKPQKERPTYKGSFPPNRFGVRPGYRWDGVVRSNGFEKTWFSRESNKKATADMAYKWSVENM